MPVPVWLPARALTSSSPRSEALHRNSVEKPENTLLEPVRKKLVNSPALWALEVSPRNRMTRSVSSLLYHQVTVPKGRAMASPFLMAITFSCFSGRTIPAIPHPSNDRAKLPLQITSKFTITHRDGNCDLRNKKRSCKKLVRMKTRMAPTIGKEEWVPEDVFQYRKE